MTWVKRWKVRSSTDGRKKYTVALDTQGDYGCSCPAWTRHTPRVNCKHIQQVLREQAEADEVNPQMEQRGDKWVIRF